MKRSKVVLVNPRMCRPHSIRLPLSVLALGAALEGSFEYQIIDGNLDDNPTASLLSAIRNEVALVAFTVMPGPQVAPAIGLASFVREAFPEIPIVWGGYFPTLYPSAAINAAYVDYVVRGQGEQTLLELLACLPESGGPLKYDSPEASSAANPRALYVIAGLTWKNRGEIIHNPDRKFRVSEETPPYPYHRLANIEAYFRPSFMGTRTAVHQASIGCRYHCTFCGVVSMFNGFTAADPARRLQQALSILRNRYFANALQFYDHNFFDSEPAAMLTLEVLADAAMPWWCYARADTLARFSRSTWELLRKSRLTMAYIGAEAASDDVLKRMRKGSRVEHTLEVARLCREYGIIPEFSFVLGGPEDPEYEIEKTLEFIRRVKKINSECEVILYFYSPTPQRERALRGRTGPSPLLPVLNAYGPNGPELPATPEEWTQPQWINYVCHQDAPWLSPRTRKRVKDFAKVLSCRFPTAQDYSTPAWGKILLKGLASWRYPTRTYRNPWELDLARRYIHLRQPQRDGL
jgi:radical SAM superfamily enzyme YgiQ (UPF0313 family)